MKQTNINIDEIKRYPTVTYPILADDLHTPQAYAYTLRRAIVTDCNDRQRAELVKLLEGKESAEGVTFNNTRVNRDRLHIWQNRESRKERAAILGEGWQYIEGLNSGTEPGDLITCLDGTRGRVTKASGESCVIEFETENGQRLSVAGYFRYTPSAKSETADELVPDVVILSSSDEYTREKFRERHEKFYKLSSYWKGEEVNTNRERDLKKHYDRESLAVHFLLSEELYYTWGEDRAARCLDNVREIYPDMTADELREIYDKYRRPVSDLYE